MQAKIQQIIKENIFALLEGETIELDTVVKGTLYINVSLDSKDQQCYWIKVHCKSCFSNCYWNDFIMVNEFGEEQSFTLV